MEEPGASPVAMGAARYHNHGKKQSRGQVFAVGVNPGRVSEFLVGVAVRSAGQRRTRMAMKTRAREQITARYNACDSWDWSIKARITQGNQLECIESFDVTRGLCHNLATVSAVGGWVTMSLQRLTLLPLSKAKAQKPVEEIESEPEGSPVEIVSITRMAQGGAWRTEAMRSYERPVLIWFTRGQGRLTISGRNCGYSPHNLVFLPAQTMHGFSTMGPVLGSVVFLPVGSAYGWPDEPAHLRLNDVRLQRELTAKIDAMLTEQESDCTQSDKALAHHAALLSIWLGRTAAAHADAPNPSPGVRMDTAAHRLAEAYTSLIERDFRHAEGVQHYAALLGVTPTHLSRVCRKVAGRPALDILTDRRHFEARRLLRDTNMQISEIAQKSGFSSPAYFTRAFRARSGQSPSEFRESR